MSDGAVPAGDSARTGRPSPGRSAGAPDGDRVVIRDRRKIDPAGREPAGSTDPATGPGAGSDPDRPPAGPADRGGPQAAAAESAAPADLQGPGGDRAAPAAETGGESGPAAGPADDPVEVTEPVAEQAPEVEVEAGPPAGGEDSGAEAIEGELVEPDVGRADTAADPGARPAEAPAGQVSAPLGAELEALRAELDERTRDLQRVTAEYANYRKRVDRDRGLTTEQAVASVLGSLMPVLDDLDRAREHGDLVGPFAAVAEQLTAAVTKFGLTAFGEKGDPFDPKRHEAVAHLTSAEVTEPTCVDVMRRGYLMGDRLLRPALVAVADPQ